MHSAQCVQREAHAKGKLAGTQIHVGAARHSTRLNGRFGDSLCCCSSQSSRCCALAIRSWAVAVASTVAMTAGQLLCGHRGWHSNSKMTSTSAKASL